MNRRECIVAGLGAAISATSHAQVAVDRTAIDWPTVHLLDGQTLACAPWQGQGAVVVFWVTDCAYCKRHSADVDKLYRASRGLPLRVVGVALDSDEQAVRRFMARQRLPLSGGGGRGRPARS